jgi:tRNA(fMet)-specific endonuclease VapC
MIVILDTDHRTAIQRRAEPAYSRLRARLSKFRSNVIQTTIVSFEEQMRGWLAVISSSRNQPREVVAYQRLQALLRFFNEIPVLDYTEAVAARFADLRRSRPRIGSMDLKIAAIVLSQDGLLLSSNVKGVQVHLNLATVGTRQIVFLTPSLFSAPSPHRQQHIRQTIHHAEQRAAGLIEMAGRGLIFRGCCVRGGARKFQVVSLEFRRRSKMNLQLV